MNTTICDELLWYKIGKFFLHTQKEKHSNGLEDRPSFSQVDKGVLWKNQNCSSQNKYTHGQKHKFNITDVLSKRYSRFSQVSPSKSSVHLHENESRLVIVHVPPFLHGCDLQGLTEEMKHYD